MQALVLHGPEDLRLEEIGEPEPGPGEVVITVESATTCATDSKILRAGSHPSLPALPTPFGHEAAGVITAVGGGVADFSMGDRVVPANSAPCEACRFCDSGATSLCEDLTYLWGAFSEKLLVPRRIVNLNLVLIPDELPFRRATLAEPLACAVRAVSRCAPTSGTSVAIIGGGTQGALLCGLLSQRGCEVTVCDPHADRRERATAFGAAHTFGALRSPSDSARLADLTGGGPDLVVEAVGAPSAWEAAVAAVRPGGTVLFYGGCPPDSTVQLPTAPLHYSEVTLTGSYHHDPVSFRTAVALLTHNALPFTTLLGDPITLNGVPDALRHRGQKRPIIIHGDG